MKTRDVAYSLQPTVYNVKPVGYSLKLTVYRQQHLLLRGTVKCGVGSNGSSSQSPNPPNKIHVTMQRVWQMCGLQQYCRGLRSHCAQIGAVSAGTTVRPFLMMRSGQPGVTVQQHVCCLIWLRNRAKMQPYAHYNSVNPPICLMKIIAKCRTPQNCWHMFATF